LLLFSTEIFKNKKKLVRKLGMVADDWKISNQEARGSQV
jgi:hypothetical protein